LNTAIKKVRQALGDSAGAPRYIETLPRKGYRFIAAAIAVPEVSSGRLAGEVADADGRKPWPSWMPRMAMAVALAVFSGAAGLFILTRRVPTQAEAPWARPFTALPGTETDPAFSPDGKSVAFSWTADSNEPFHIYIKQIDTEKPVQLTAASHNDFSPAWSPDGRLIAFCRYAHGQASEVIVVPAAGGLETAVASVTVALGSDLRPFLAWTPDGSALVLTDADEIVPVGAAVPDPPSARKAGASLFLVTLDGRRHTRLTSPPPGHRDGSPAFSPDGRTLAFARLGRERGIYTVPLSPDFLPRGEPRAVTRGEDLDAAPVWTPDGREIIFATGLNRGTPPPSGLWRVPASGTGEPTRLEFAGHDASYPTISRSGKLVFAQGVRDVNVWRIELSGPGDPAHTPPRCVVCSTRSDSIPRFSPDGKRIAFISNRTGSPEVWTAGGDGGDELRLTNMRATVTGSPAWSTNNSHILFDSNPGGRFRIYSVPASGGTVSALTNDSSNNACATYSHDGRWIYFTSDRTGTFQIWKMPAGGGSAVQITRKGGRVATEAEDGRFLYYATSATDRMQESIWRVPVDGGDETLVIASAAPFNHAVVPQGIYFLRSGEGQPPHAVEFFRFADRNTSIVPGTERTTRGTGVSASPDGRALLFTREDQAGADLMIVDHFR